jgi:hypothetical protein
MTARSQEMCGPRHRTDFVMTLAMRLISQHDFSFLLKEKLDQQEHRVALF